MPIIPSMVLAVLVPWSAATAQGAEPAKPNPWPCRLIPTSASVRALIDKGIERSETIRRQCQELAASRAVVVIEWGVKDSQSHAKTAMEVRDGVVVANVKIPPLGDRIVLFAHELQHVIEQTAGLDLRAEAKRVGSGVLESFDGYETLAAVGVSRRVADELRAYSKAARRRRNVQPQYSSPALRFFFRKSGFISKPSPGPVGTFR